MMSNTLAAGLSAIPTPSTGFRTLDWAVLAFYALLLAAAGWLSSRRKQKSTDDYFLAGRRMPAFAVAFSVLSAAISAASFIGGPQQSYTGNLTFLAANIGTIIAVLVVARFFVPEYYRSNSATIYQFLGSRCGQPARYATSTAFLIGRLFADGARLYIAALPASWMIFGDGATAHVMIGIAILTVVGTVFTLVGGVGTVIWTDVIQTSVFIIAAAAALILLLTRIPLSPSEIADVLRTAGPNGSSKLTIIDPGLHFNQPHLGFDPAAPYTLLAAIFGISFLNLAAYGTDYLLVQRLLTCKSAGKAAWSVILAILINLPVMLVLMSIGLLLFIYYQRPDLLLPADHAASIAAAPSQSRDVFLNFIIHQMPAGLIGLMFAGLFAAALATSTVNSMAAVFVLDLYRPAQPGRDERHYLRVSRFAVVVIGLLLGAVACLCILWHQKSGKTLIDFALAVMTFAYGGMLGVFVTAIFTRRGNSATIIAALLAGFFIVLIFQPDVWTWLIIKLGPAAPDGKPSLGTQHLADFRLAFGWPMMLASLTSFLICCLGRRRPEYAAPTLTLK